MKILSPIVLVPAYYVETEREIQRVFDNEIFSPLLKSVGWKIKEVTNAKDALLEAVERGILSYQEGYFQGRVNARISKRLIEIGAKYDGRKGMWYVMRGNIPPHILTAQFRADEEFKRLRDSLIKTAEGIDIDQAFQKYGFTEKYDRALARMNERFEETVAGVTIAPTFTSAQREFLAREYAQNLQLYIKDWTAKSIIDLRKDVMDNAFAGRRAESMINMIQGEYGFSKRKAKFLARQETSLLMSNFRESRYAEVGVTEYIWSGKDDGRERPDHVRLNETRHRFSNPPITDRATGRRCNPGEDYGCRCTARPLFKGY